MIYESPSVDVPLSQGDMIDDCTVLAWKPFQTSFTESTVGEYFVRVVVITQACDLAQTKSERVLVAVVHDAQSLVDRGVLKASLIRDQIRMHRVYGWYFLPAGEGVPESVVDLRDLHTVPRTMLAGLIAGGQRLSRIVTPYREHLAQHFATTYSRIAQGGTGWLALEPTGARRYASKLAACTIRAGVSGIYGGCVLTA